MKTFFKKNKTSLIWGTIIVGSIYGIYWYNTSPKSPKVKRTSASANPANVLK